MTQETVSNNKPVEVSYEVGEILKELMEKREEWEVTLLSPSVTLLNSIGISNPKAEAFLSELPYKTRVSIIKNGFIQKEQELFAYHVQLKFKIEHEEQLLSPYANSNTNTWSRNCIVITHKKNKNDIIRLAHSKLNLNSRLYPLVQIVVNKLTEDGELVKYY